MKWSEVRKQYPDRLVLVEAIKAYSKNRVRTIEEMSVVEEYTGSKVAWAGYKNYHRQFPERELYIFHTGKENIEVIEHYFTWVRSRV
jgi:hypothetical protein